MNFIITGNIGSGKSTLLKILKEEGFITYNVDDFAKESYSKNIGKIRDIFGTDNRRKIREVVFQNKNALETLEKIILPYVYDKISEILYTEDNVFIELPTYFEHKLYQEFRFPVILAYAPKEVCWERATKRDNISIDNIRNIFNNQIDIEEKKKYSNIVINTNQSIEKVKKDLLEKLKIYNIFFATP